ncbi:DnaJ-domain-containing protein [Anaeromyces robustus]|uniref:DnaJ-domain-containing protein n=1 Tax=Anaeromyces robustus TaxID=1754192 RepID=A0A1Y1XJU6_9FUNG|nr:DnaJ-domain-containing protein [Anaeromyces robustus]|eukprot:ORX85992.1 DnaJ-domain-containing protein [Anaeromyces robustus]
MSTFFRNFRGNADVAGSSSNNVEDDYYTLIDYYAILGVDPKATPEQIREAYIELAVKNHPDNIYEDASYNEHAEDQEYQRNVKKRFQQINQAYFILSDPQRRQIYDSQYNEYCFAANSNFEVEHNVSAKKSDPDKIFGNVFEELFTPSPDIQKPHTFWKPLGGAAGIVLGFICMNMPGAVAGGIAGAKLGQIRDSKGCSVYDAFKKLDKSKKAQILSEITKEVVQRAAAIKK